MAIVAMQGSAESAVAIQSIVEGLAVVIAGSGAHNELPGVRIADAGATQGVYVLIVPPDSFETPTLAGFYAYPGSVTVDPRNAGAPVWSSTTWYRTPLSTQEEPTVQSGWLSQIHRDGIYTVTSNCYTDSAGIRVPGSLVKVGSNGKWTTTSTASEAVGTVRECVNGYLTFRLGTI